VKNPQISKLKRVGEVIRGGVDEKTIRINEFHPSPVTQWIKILLIQDLTDGGLEQEKLMRQVNKLRIKIPAPLSNLMKDSNLLKRE
jgi:hypothetical protein